MRLIRLVVAASSSVLSVDDETKMNRKKHEGSLLEVFSDAGSTPAASTISRLFFFNDIEIVLDEFELILCWHRRMTAPLITIFVRHGSTDGKPCRCAGDEFSKRCDCRKHLRWSATGEQHRRKAGTRSWAEAEQVERDLEDQLARWKSEPRTDARDLQGSIEVFIEDKRFQGVAAGVVAKYSLQPRRLREFCEASGVFTVQGVSRELIAGFCATWETLHPSGITRAKKPEKLRSFLRYCYDARWPERIPAVPKFKLDDVETQPLTPKEYIRLIDGVYGTIDSIQGGVELQPKVYAFLQTMRWTGLVIRDTMTRKRSALEYDAAKDFTEGARSARRLGRQFLSQSFRCSEGSFSSARTGKYFFFGPVRGCRNPLRAVGDDNDTLPRSSRQRALSVTGISLSHRERPAWGLQRTGWTGRMG